MRALTTRRLILCILLCVSLLPRAEEGAQPPSSDSFKEKVAAFAAEIDRETKAGTIQDNGETKALRGHLDSIQRFHDANIDAHGMEFQIHGLCEHAGRVSPGLAKVCEDLLDSVQSANREASAELARTSDALLAEAAQAIRLAKKPSDLDAIRTKVEQATHIPGNQHLDDFNSLTRLREASEVVGTWQEALKDFEKGDLSSASSKVSSASNRARSPFGSTLPPSFFDETGEAWAAYWRSYVGKELEEAKRNLAAAKTPAEAMRVNDALTNLQHFQFSDRAMGLGTIRRINISHTISREWADLLRAEADGKDRNALNTLDQIGNEAREEGMIVSPTDIDAKRQAIYAAVGQKVRATLDSAGKQLVAVRTPEETQLMENGLDQCQEILDRRGNEYSDLILKIAQWKRVAQAWRGVIGAQNNQDSDAMLRSLNELARVSAGGDPLVPGAAVEEKRKLAASFSPESPTSPTGAWLATLPDRITGINKANDVATLLTEIRAHLVTLSASATLRDEIYHLQSDLNALSSFATACEQGRVFFWFGLNSSVVGAPHRWQKQTAEVRARLATKALATQLGKPELATRSLDMVSLEQTILKLADEAAKGKDWRRVYDLLQVCASSDARLGPEGSHMNEELAGIAEFFAAERLEKAQQWPEAVRSYQNVLRRMGNRLPIDEATERLKVLKQEHPEVEAHAAQPAPVRR